jgi:Cdc6-like AAA superfamily ATPase
MPAEKLGQPCWIKDHVDQAIRPIARTDKEGIDYFLASHTPINNIRHDETDELFNEETLFHNIFSSKGEVLALIHGNPGTGKSHLIHWLKLRTEDALKNKAFKEKVVPVLIQRRTGTLKDALEQIIEQLGEQFSGYLSDVRR